LDKLMLEELKRSARAPALAGLILAGGASTRMGAPKPIMPWGDQTFVQAVIDKMKAIGAAPLIVVLGAHFKEASQHCASLGASPIFHEQWPLGQFSSLQAGVRELSGLLLSAETAEPNRAAISGAMVALVDQPHIDAEVFATVARQSRQFPDRIVIPTCEQRRGHPYVIPRRLFSSLLAMPQTATARDFLLTHAPRQFLTPVADAGIHFDIDTPEDLLLAQARYHM
jgi:CTP:molybdopterin cytidylyltransferase MocA